MNAAQRANYGELPLGMAEGHAADSFGGPYIGPDAVTALVYGEAHSSELPHAVRLPEGVAVDILDHNADQFLVLLEDGRTVTLRDADLKDGQFDALWSLMFDEDDPESIVTDRHCSRCEKRLAAPRRKTPS